MERSESNIRSSSTTRRLPAILRAQNIITNDEDDEHFVETFTTRFRSQRSGQSPPVTGRRHQVRRLRRGRPVKEYKMRFVALKDPSQKKRPTSWKALKALRHIGLGNLPEDCAVPSSLNHAEFEEFMWQQFPILRGKGLSFAKSKANGDLSLLPQDCTPASLKRERSKRCIYILPTEPLTVPQNQRSICETCSRSMRLGSSECLLCQQDREFSDSAVRDRERENQVHIQQVSEQRLLQIRQERAELIRSVPEPENGFSVKCRTSEGGCFQRKFLQNDALSMLVTWIGSQEQATENFTMTVVGRETMSSTEAGDRTLSDVGIDSPCVVNVAWVEPDMRPISDEASPAAASSSHAENDERSENDTGTPGVQFNPLSNDSEDDFDETLPEVLPQPLPIEIEDDDYEESQHEESSLNLSSTAPLPPPRSPSPPPPMEERREIHIHRINILEDMITAFSNDDIMDQNLKFIFISESGIDQEGLSREAYSSFWDEFYLRRTSGNNSKVPCVTTQYCRNDWLAIGKILVKGMNDHKIFPIQLNFAFIVAMVLGEQSLTREILISSLESYVTDDVKEILQRSRDSPIDDEEESELLDFLADSGWSGQIPSYRNEVEFDRCLHQIAHTVLVQVPKYPLGCFAEVARAPLSSIFPNVSSISEFLKKTTPTNRKVTKLLTADPSTPRETATLDLLKSYVRGLGKEKLGAFLKFCTGSSIISVDAINVTFNTFTGLQRRPIARTCGPVLEISTMYVDVADLGFEINSVLNSGNSGLTYTIS